MEATAATPGQSSQRPPFDMEDHNHEWQVNFLNQVLKEEDGPDSLLSLLEKVWDMNDCIDPTLSMVRLLEDFTSNTQNDLNTPQHREMIGAITSHISLIAELRERFKCFDLTTSYTHEADRSRRMAHRLQQMAHQANR